MQYNLETVRAVREALRDNVTVYVTDGQTISFVTSMLSDGRFMAYDIDFGAPVILGRNLKFYAEI